MENGIEANDLATNWLSEEINTLHTTVDGVIEAADRITGMRVQAETLDAGSGATAACRGC